MSLVQNRADAWPITRLLNDARDGNDWLWRSTLAFGAGLLICMALMLIDHRLFNGVSVWDKPAKFFLSLGVQFATVSWAISLLPKRDATGVRVAAVAMSLAAWFELIYMMFRASRSEASHFNDTTILAHVMYGAMGIGALTLTTTAFYIGYIVWQQRKQSLIVEATGLGLMLGMILATVAGGYMSAQTSHWVGGDLNDAHGLGIFAWSTTGGDLRVAHFVGMHVAQFLPLAAVSGDRRLVLFLAAVSVLATGVIFIQAVLGNPLLHV